MIFIGYDNNGTDGSNLALVTAIYELDGERIYIPASTLPGDVEAAVLAGSSKLARQALNDLITNNQDKLKYADYFFRLQKSMLAMWITKPLLNAQTSGVVTALQGNRVTDVDHAAMWSVFIWIAGEEYGIPITTGGTFDELPAVPTVAQRRDILHAARAFMTAGVEAMNMLLRG
jgi:hypothetical protein